MHYDQMDENGDFVWADGACVLGHYFSSSCILPAYVVSGLDAAGVIFCLFLASFACALLDYDCISGYLRQKLFDCSILDHWRSHLGSFGNPKVSFIGLLKNQMNNRNSTVSNWHPV